MQKIVLLLAAMFLGYAIGLFHEYLARPQIEIVVGKPIDSVITASPKREHSDRET